MKIVSTPIDGLVIVETTKHVDHRGAFFRAYCQDELASIIEERRIVQINISKNHAVGAARGMHYQCSPQAEMKLIRCIKGKVWDVAVDLRADSPTFLKWHAEVLSPENSLMYVIPEGCAHGFQVLEADSELLYLHTAPYCPEVEGALNMRDPAISISWPIEITDISERDRTHEFIKDNFRGISI